MCVCVSVGVCLGGVHADGMFVSVVDVIHIQLWYMWCVCIHGLCSISESVCVVNGMCVSTYHSVCMGDVCVCVYVVSVMCVCYVCDVCIVSVVYVLCVVCACVMHVCVHLTIGIGENGTFPTCEIMMV